MKIRKIITALLIIMFTTILVSCKNDDRIKIGILQYANASALNEAKEGFIKALEDNGLTEDNVKFTLEIANADTTIIKQQAMKLIRNSDLVLAIATPAAQFVQIEAQANNKNIPIFFTAVTDPVDAGLIDKDTLTGNNITGTNDMNPVREQILLGKELLPDSETLGILYSSDEPNSHLQSEIAQQVAEELGLEVVIETINSVGDLQQTARSLASKVDFIFIPTDNQIADNITVLDPILRTAKIPAVVGEENMAQAIPALTYGINYFDLGYLTGTQAVEFLLNKKEIKDIPSTGLSTFKLVVNVDALDNIDVTIPSSILDRLN